MKAHVCTVGKQREVIAVLRNGDWNEAEPSWLLGRVHIDLRGDPYSESHYEDLLRTLHGPRVESPPIGRHPDFGVRAAASSPPPVPGTEDWGLMNRRRAELIHKKNRQGLTAAEQLEFERLQGLCFSALENHFPPPVIDEEGLRRLRESL